MDQIQKRLNRHSIRLSGYDYTRLGAYFVTVCTIKRENLFGRIENNKLVLSQYGEIAGSECRNTREIRRNADVDEFIVMPNHVHGILLIEESPGATRRVAPGGIGREFIDVNAGRPHGPAIGSVGSIMGQYKSIVAKRINRIRNSTGESVWQRNYYEHVIRDEEDLNDVRYYIRNNAIKWADDHENPDFEAVMRCIAVPVDKSPGLSR